ncbi:MAG: type II toxin-antitoxin system Phd/YefM family antitoxin [Methanomassiliicoccaceae archaeon]|nr:type II toxin-antitoxin system Phd/YefM family antitoxin [Methanomassiliicoccaceae archaeon]MCL2146114.1 type II toxin-antitoxin system Phd/YefM family antitoxin [Methanomassiliicoccaceae archaeon]
MTTVNASEARANLYNLIESAIDEPVRITSKRGTVVMISEEEWEGIMETLYLLGVPGLLEDVKKGRETPRSKMIRVKSSDL